MTVKERFDQHLEDAWRESQSLFPEEEQESFRRIFLLFVRTGAVCASVAIGETLDASQKLWKRPRTVKQVAECHMELMRKIEEDVNRSKGTVNNQEKGEPRR